MSDLPGASESKRERAAAKRRSLILEAAMICFLERGYHQSGVRDIAKQAGVSLGNLYNHFPGKHDVLVEIAAVERTELEPILKLLKKPKPARAVLNQFVSKYAALVAEPENVILTIEIASEAIRKPDIGELFLTNRNELVRALEAVIKRGTAEGDFRTMPNAHEAAQHIIELIDGSAYRSVLSEIAMRKLLNNLNDFIFAALEVKPRRT
ncbi:MAG: TetR/AcrR family transcriptional regulator [Pseudomonadota bacterium]